MFEKSNIYEYMCMWAISSTTAEGPYISHAITEKLSCYVCLHKADYLSCQLGSQQGCFGANEIPVSLWKWKTNDAKETSAVKTNKDKKALMNLSLDWLKKVHALLRCIGNGGCLGKLVVPVKFYPLISSIHSWTFCCISKILFNIAKLGFNRNKANLRDLIDATGLVILLKLDSNRRFFSPCDLDIWWMAPKTNRAPLLYYIKLCASFEIYQ